MIGMSETGDTTEAAVDTARALLDAGRRLFARHGYEGASVRTLTTEAGSNLGAITYHFGSKRELYDRVVVDMVTPLAARVESVIGGGGGVLDRAGAVVRAYFDYLAEHPELPQLMMQQLAAGGEPSDTVTVPLKRVHAALTSLVAEGQARGEVRSGPRLVLGVFILSVPVHLAMLRLPLGRFAGLDLLDAKARERVVASAVEFVREGLRARPESREA